MHYVPINIFPQNSVGINMFRATSRLFGTLPARMLAVQYTLPRPRVLGNLLASWVHIPCEILFFRLYVDPAFFFRNKLPAFQRCFSTVYVSLLFQCKAEFLSSASVVKPSWLNLELGRQIGRPEIGSRNIISVDLP